MNTPELLNEKNIRNNKANSKSVASASVRAVELYSGPIPPASELTKYESVLPGAADRILGMAEKQAQHRHKMEDKMLDASIAAERAGQIFGFAIFGLAIVAGFILIMLGKDVAGLVSLVIAIGSIIGLFVYTRADAKKELKKKDATKKRV